MSFVQVWNHEENTEPKQADNVDDALQPGAYVWVSREVVSHPPKRRRKKKTLALPDENFPWKLVSILSREKDVIAVKIDGKIIPMIVNSKLQCLPFEAQVVEDMRDLHYPHPPGILHNLKSRANSRKPYTFVGNVLISINPLRHIPDPDIMTSDDEQDWSIPLPPHPRSIAEKAFRQMLFTCSQRLRLMEIDDSKVRPTIMAPNAAELENKESDFAKKFGLINQTIIVSGESGSGKTEASKRVLQQLVERELVGISIDDDEVDEEEEFQDRLLGSTMLLECLGNATTNRNPNSSRYGSYLRLNYQPVYHDDSYSPSFYTYGASFTTYLLERSRVTHQNPGERNFNIFYQLLTSSRKSIQGRLRFDKAKKKFRYLGYRFQPSENDKRGYTKLRTALSMANLGIKKGLLFEVIAAVLHLGNIEFEEKNLNGESTAQIVKPERVVKTLLQKKGLAKKRQSVKDIMRDSGRSGIDITPQVGLLKPKPKLGLKKPLEKRKSTLSVMSTNTIDSDITFYERANSGAPKAYNPFKESCKFLGLKQRDVARILLQKVVKAGKDTILTYTTVENAEKKRDALAKQIYSLLFDWVVYVINKGFTAEPDEENIDTTSFIGILDIFGFENFTRNSLEQLLINYANEVLLSLFVREIVIDESALYKREGLLLNEGELDGLLEQANSYDEMIQVFEGSKTVKYGILKVINSQRRVPDPSDKKLLSTIHKAFKNNDKFPKVHPSRKHLCFSIKHFASVVEYETEGFLMKNNQSLSPELKGLFKGSTHNIVKDFAKIYVRKAQSFSNAGLRSSNNLLPSKNGKMGIPTTVCSIFKSQLNELREVLSRTNCYYIRCVKPNPTLFVDKLKTFMDDTLSESSHIKALQISTKRFHSLRKQQNLRTAMINKRRAGSKTYFDAGYVNDQLKNMGVYDCVNVLKCGLQTRIPYSAFTSIFKEHFPLKHVRFYKLRSRRFREKLYVGTLLKLYSQGSAVYKLGRTKVFFPAGELEQFQEILATATNQLNGKSKRRLARHFIQRYTDRVWKICFIKIVARKTFLNLLKRSRSASLLQRVVRKYLFVKLFTARVVRRRGATGLQKLWRGYKCRKNFKEMKLEREAELLRLSQTNSVETYSDIESEFDEIGEAKAIDTTDFGETDAFETNLTRYYERKTTVKTDGQSARSLKPAKRKPVRTNKKGTFYDLTKDWDAIEMNLKVMDGPGGDSDCDSLTDTDSDLSEKEENVFTLQDIREAEMKSPPKHPKSRQMPGTRQVRITVNKLNPRKAKHRKRKTVSFPEWRDFQLKPVLRKPKQKIRVKEESTVDRAVEEHDVSRRAQNVWGATLRRVRNRDRL